MLTGLHLPLELRRAENNIHRFYALTTKCCWFTVKSRTLCRCIVHFLTCFIPATPPTTTTTKSTTMKPTTTSTTTKKTTTPSTTTTTTSTTMKPTTTSTTTKKPSNFTLICVFEYLSPGLWNKTDQCTDYVYIRLFSYTETSSEPITFVKKSKTPPGKFAVTYYDDHQETWADYDIKQPNRVAIAMRRHPHARWFVGMWGTTYMRLMAALFNVRSMKTGLHDALRASSFGARLSMANFSGFAIIHSPIYDSRVIQVSEDWGSIFRTDRFSPAVLEPNWFFLHTASIRSLPPLTANREDMTRQVMGNADLMGVATSNTTYEDNRLLRRGSTYSEYKQASPPNPIRAAHPKARGMLDILKTFPYWKKTLNQSRLCFSVTSAINFAASNARVIDFHDDIGGVDDAVQRYTRMRFARRRPFGSARLLPVEAEDCTYGFDNHTQTHFWRWYYRGKMLRFFAYDKADTLGPKVTQLLNAYPDDKCIVFDDLGEDGRGATLSAGGTTVEFKAYELLHAVVKAMTARYGPAFPAQYY
ncbi:uncharacterized protein LOC144139298 [Haemaphysalis longicornis]